MPALTIENLTVDIPDGRRLLGVPALRVAQGECLAIKGPSGAGKSTLLLALAGLVPAMQGRVLWGDVDLVKEPEAQRTAFRGRTFGIVFQNHLLFDELSAEANASLSSLFAPAGQRQSIRAKASAALSDLGLRAGVGRRTSTYSGGERQRIAVARALAGDPPVILADEPTASLDRDTADGLIADLFSDAKQNGRTLIVVSHDPSVLAAADRVITVKDGRLEAA